MSEPLRLDHPRPGDASEPDKEARIEQLLLTGLDHYFAGQFDQAINVWTRVVFLERGHDRARAYIERARGALAEQHRESEELLHRGVAAFDRGETDEARDLITRAVERGGPHDVALVFLERLNRLGTGVLAPEAPAASAPDGRTRSGSEAARSPDAHHWAVRVLGIVSLAGAAIAGLLLGGAPLSELVTGRSAALPEQVLAVRPDPPPVVRTSELMMARARSLRSGGHLYDALRLLEAIDVADPVRGEADRLRGELQRQLLELGADRSGPLGGTR